MFYPSRTKTKGYIGDELNTFSFVLSQLEIEFTYYSLTRVCDINHDPYVSTSSTVKGTV